jgi:hypothetical protein
MDLWSEVFATPGTRINGERGGVFAFTGPNWVGSLPDCVERIRSPTDMVWILGRTETFDEADYPAVYAIQDGFTRTPLSMWGASDDGGPRRASAARSKTTFEPESPLEVVEQMTAEEFFELFSRLLRVNPPHEVDWPIVAQMRQVGLVVGEPLCFADLDPASREVLEQGLEQGLALIRNQGSRELTPAPEGWRSALSGIGSYGAAYTQRAYVARIGLGANRVEDAIYPSSAIDADGRDYSGDCSYVLRFEAGDLPPIRAFWSLTLYQNQFLAENAEDRYAVRSNDERQFEEDGSLEICIQHARPERRETVNWLPAPLGQFDLMLRLYAPERDVLTGEWRPPGVRRLDEA